MRPVVSFIKQHWFHLFFFGVIFFVLRLISFHLESTTGKYSGALYYISFSFIYAFLSYLLRKKLKSNKKHLLFLFSSLFLVGTPPLFENDHYRYIWEGKVLSHGESPYLKGPSSKELKYIAYEKKKNIAYNKLSTIYPPIALGYFALVGKLDYKLALIILQIFSIIILFFLIYQWNSTEDESMAFLWTLPFILKEFVQSVHIDVLAVAFFFQALRGNGYLSKLIYLLLSFWTKFLAVIYFPYWFLELWRKNERKRALSALVIFIITLILFYLFVPLKSGEFSGHSAFAKHWLWHSLSFSLFHNLIGIEYALARKVTLVCTLLFIVLPFLFYVFNLRRIKDGQALIYCSFSFLGLFLFSPVLHPWYLFWLFPFFVFLKEDKLCLIFPLSAVIYYPYGGEELRFIGEMITGGVLIYAFHRLLGALRGNNL